MDHGFQVATFAMDGELEGVGQRRFDQLSSKWLAVCADLFQRHGAVFIENWPVDLPNTEVRFTSEAGNALVTLNYCGLAVASAALLNGGNLVAELELLEMFASSLGAAKRSKAPDAQAPFSAAMQVAERPLLVVVSWAHERIPQRVCDVARELLLHLAAAYFLRSKLGSQLVS